MEAGGLGAALLGLLLPIIESVEVVVETTRVESERVSRDGRDSSSRSSGRRGAYPDCSCDYVLHRV